jgi:hypothetical protein
LAVRVRDEWPLLRGLLRSLSGVCEEAWVLDDASETPMPLDILDELPSVTVLRADRWSGEGGRLGEGLERDSLLQRMKSASQCDWVLQLDCDERISAPRALVALAADLAVDGWVLPLIDYYITPEDADLEDLAEPGRVRNWFGPETRWTFCLFRLMPTTHISRGDVREPQGFAAGRVHETEACLVEHYGKSVSIAEWERKCDFYAAHYPVYREKWLARRGEAVHHGVSDFGTRLLRRDGDAFRPADAPAIYRFRVEPGLRAVIRRWLYGRLRLALWPGRRLSLRKVGHP